MILIIGGCEDFNIHTLAEVACQQNIDNYLLFCNGSEQSSIVWNINQDKLIIDGQILSPKAIFIRPDAFGVTGEETSLAQLVSHSFYHTLYGWALAHSEINMLNASFGEYSKPLSLFLAQKQGLKIPDTLFTNNYSLLENLETTYFITKPVAGGDFCYSLDSALTDFEWIERKGKAITTVQNKLIQPEFRYYIIGDNTFSFKMVTSSLDYRISQDVNILYEGEAPMPLALRLKALMKDLKLNFAAADFKTDPETGELVFLEINSSPMFGAFDKVSDNAISKSILKTLLNPIFDNKII